MSKGGKKGRMGEEEDEEGRRQRESIQAKAFHT